MQNAPSTPDPAQCDLLIHGAEVYDGSGEPARMVDVAVAGDRITAVGDLAAAMAATARVDGSGLALAPGFIDAHTHDDRAVLSNPTMAMKLSQGVTTVIGGNCGISLAPLAGVDPPPPLNLLGNREWFRFATMAEYFGAVEQSPPALNISVFAGHSSLRAGAMDSLGRAATASEIDTMAKRLDESLEAGCIGMSTGLAYPPAFNAPTDEVVALCEVMASRGGIYATHMRNEKEHVVQSVDETIDIGKRASVPVVISHHKCSGRRNWGLTRQTLERIAQARRGARVNLDVYPYVASSTVLLEAWIADAESVRVTWSEPHPEMNGRDINDISAQWGLDMAATVAKLQPAGAIYFQMDEADLRRVLAFPDAMVGSDGLPHDAVPHPRLWGTFPRVLGHYARDLGLLSMTEAVRRMTTVPAAVFGLQERGRIEAGAYADLVLFDARNIIDRATFDQPTEPSRGIERVWVNGQSVWAGGEPTGNLPGRALRRAP